MSLRSRLERLALERLLAIVDRESRPDIDLLRGISQRLSVMELNVKAFGYQLARRLAADLPPIGETAPVHAGLRSKPSVQADLEAPWARHWLAELKIPLIFHRKLWELAHVLQALWEHGLMEPGRRGLGFGCGIEPIPSYLASRGVAATVTDLAAEDARSAGWAATNQHAASLDLAFRPELVDRDAFDRLVDHRVVDMNAIPDSLAGYDFCWSVCAMEHLGSIDRGLAFVERSLATLRPGGLAVHTMEYNVVDGPTIEQGGTVLFTRSHLEALAARLAAAGHRVAPLDFDLGDGPMDRFVDVPPWSHEMPADLGPWLGDPLHMKIGFAGFVSTCFGIVVAKADG